MLVLVLVLVVPQVTVAATVPTTYSPVATPRKQLMQCCSQCHVALWLGSAWLGLFFLVALRLELIKFSLLFHCFLRSFFA